VKITIKPRYDDAAEKWVQCEHNGARFELLVRRLPHYARTAIELALANSPDRTRELLRIWSHGLRDPVMRQSIPPVISAIRGLSRQEFERAFECAIEGAVGDDLPQSPELIEYALACCPQAINAAAEALRELDEEYAKKNSG
jgi:hypothetical protein